MSGPYSQTLVSAETLLQHLQDPDWVVIDCHFDLAKPDWGFENYQEGHIPGAVYAHLDHDLSGPITPVTGRHPLPDMAKFCATLSSWGIQSETQVVVYDTAGGAIASRLWWMLRSLGHTKTALLNGGYKVWKKAAFPEEQGIRTRLSSVFIPVNKTWTAVVSAEEVEQIRSRPDFRLIDARAKERFEGINEPIDPVPGHIPGAINRFHVYNLRPDGLFLSPETLKSQFTDLIGDIPPDQVVVYCGSGVTSCHHVLAMEIAGFSGVRLYAGSWSEWIRDPNRPIFPNNR